jgi:hypothetical protein
MSHIPVNHPMRPFYRFLAAVAGLYVLVFGIVALTKTEGKPAFSQTETAWALGLRANLGFAVVSIVAGAIVLACAVIGRNVDRLVNIWGGLAFMVVGVAFLMLMQTNANFFAFSMADCIASSVIGTVLFSAGLYAKTAPVAATVTAPAAQAQTATEATA